MSFKSSLKKITKIGAIICITGLLPAIGFAQGKSPQPKVKHITVTEEYIEKGATKSRPDSETRYDQAGNVTEELEYKDGVFDKHLRYEYDSSGNKTKVTELDKNGNIEKVTIYRYDKGLKVEKAVYDKAQKLKSRKIYKYELY